MLVLVNGACDDGGGGGRRRSEIAPDLPEPTPEEREQWRMQQKIEEQVDNVRTLQEATRDREAARQELEVITAEEAELEKALEQVTSADEVNAIKRKQAELYRRKQNANVRFYGSGSGNSPGSGTAVGSGVLL